MKTEVAGVVEMVEPGQEAKTAGLKHSQTCIYYLGGLKRRGMFPNPALLISMSLFQDCRVAVVDMGAREEIAETGSKVGEPSNILAAVSADPVGVVMEVMRGVEVKVATAALAETEQCSLSVAL
jgi:hypothetical protein